MALAEVFKALGDPLRLELVQRLATGEPRTIGSLLADMDISRQGARKHLQVLVDAELVTLKTQGREVIVQLDPVVLDEAKSYIAELELRWDKRLEALRNFVENEP